MNERIDLEPAYENAFYKVIQHWAPQAETILVSAADGMLEGAGHAGRAPYHCEMRGMEISEESPGAWGVGADRRRMEEGCIEHLALASGNRLLLGFVRRPGEDYADPMRAIEALSRVRKIRKIWLVLKTNKTGHICCVTEYQEESISARRSVLRVTQKLQIISR